MYDFLHKKKKKFNKNELLKNLAKVLNYMHLNSICHRDIKSLNILIDKNYEPKLIDFGLAIEFQNLSKAKNLYTATPSYSAPEIFKKS